MQNPRGLNRGRRIGSQCSANAMIWLWLLIGAAQADFFHVESDRNCVKELCPKADYFHYYNCNGARCDFHLQALRCVPTGTANTGKTTLINSLHVESPLSVAYRPTLEDTYWIQTSYEGSDQPKEVIAFHDSGGIQLETDLRKNLISLADCFILVFSVVDRKSFMAIDVFKKAIDKQQSKDRKEVLFVLVGTKSDLPGRQVDTQEAQQWAAREKGKLYGGTHNAVAVRYFEMCAGDRSAVVEVIHYIVGRHFHSSKDSKFSLSKKLKPERSNTQILMDF